MQNHVHWLHLVRETVFLRITFLGENFWTPPIGGGKMTETSDRRQIYRVRFDPDKNRPSFVLIDSSDCADIQQGKRLKYYYNTLLKFYAILKITFQPFLSLSRFQARIKTYFILCRKMGNGIILLFLTKISHFKTELFIQEQKIGRD